MKRCPSGQYYDTAVSRCQGCDDICYWDYQKDPDSDCNKFCPGFSQGGHAGHDESTSTSPSVNVPMVVSVIAGVVIVAIVLVVLLWRRYGRRGPTPIDVVQKTNLVTQPSDSPPEMGYPELCIDRDTLRRNGENSEDHLLTGSDNSGN